MEDIFSKKISIVGLGYIGLPTATLFASAGFNVLGFDVNKKVVEELNKGNILIEEPFLKEKLVEVVKSKNLKAVNSVEESDVFIICVPTPITKEKKSDVSYVVSATKEIAKVLKKGNLVVLESTSPVGTTDDVILPILEETGLKAGVDFYLGHSPERVLPGKILHELVHNDRIVGGINPESTEKIEKLYKTFVQGTIHKTDARTAELAKLTENTFRDVNIALANELSVLCEEEGIDVWELVDLVNNHPRVNLHQPGPGVGGHCIAVDPWFIIEKQSLSKVISSSRAINDYMPEKTANSIKEIVGEGKKKVTILGITYKPDVDDLRESPIEKVITNLKQISDFDITIYDPHVMEKEFKYKDLLCSTIEEASKDSDILVLAVNHQVFKDIDYEKIGQLMRTKNIYDTRNFVDESKVKALGYNYRKLGSGKFE